jgi:hypothetical protein
MTISRADSVMYKIAVAKSNWLKNKVMYPVINTLRRPQVIGATIGGTLGGAEGTLAAAEKNLKQPKDSKKQKRKRLVYGATAGAVIGGAFGGALMHKVTKYRQQSLIDKANKIIKNSQGPTLDDILHGYDD